MITVLRTGNRADLSDENMRWILDRVVVHPKSGCWIWTNSAKQNGYGGSKRGEAHRVVGIMMFGPLKRLELVTHNCDTKTCVKPEHLVLGTHASNLTEAYERGLRKPRRTSDADIAKRKAKYAEAAALKAQGMTDKQIGLVMGLARSSVSEILTAKGESLRATKGKLKGPRLRHDDTP